MFGVLGMGPAAAQRRSVTAAVVGGLLTLAVVTLPSLRFAYRSLGGHLVLETTVALVGALVALLVYGRYRRSGALSELLLVYAMSLLSVTAAVLVMLPALFGEGGDSRAAGIWAALLVRLVGAVLIVAAALVSPHRRHRVARPWREVAVALLVVAVVAGVVLALSSGWPDAVRVSVTPEASGRPSFESHPVVLVAQILNLACYAVAAVAFTRRAAMNGDDMLGWFGAACALGAWARVNYLLFPSLYTDWLYTGDLLRLGFYALLLVGAVREIREYWSAQAIVAVEAERRRMARDLHDGVVQELGWIRSASLRGIDRAQLVAAADRALDEARRALSALTAPLDEPFAVTLGRAVSEVGDRNDVPVRLQLDAAVDVPAEHRESLVRVAREAVTNAARHGAARNVSVLLAPGRLEVDDDGTGFDASTRGSVGHGLTSMRERAEGMGARLRVRSAPGQGTCVEVTW